MLNVEWFKYVNKKHDRTTVTFYESAGTQQSTCVDEVKMYYNCRYLSSCEAAWIIFCFDIHHKEPTIERLSFHLPNEQYVIYGEDAPIEDVIQKPKNNTSKFLAWMETNKFYLKARNLLYAQIPSQFVWKQCEWVWYPK